MRKLWMAGVLAVVVVGLLTTTAAVAGWFWDDPAWKIGDTEVHFLWAVDNPNGDYRSQIGLVHPKGVEVELLTPSTKTDRAYDVASPQLKVTRKGVEIQGVFQIKAKKGADANVLAEIRTADGVLLASGNGRTNGKIVLSAVVPQDD